MYAGWTHVFSSLVNTYSPNCVRRTPSSIRSQKKSRFFATDLQIAWPLEERSCPGYERHNAHDSFCDQCEMTVGPRDL